MNFNVYYIIKARERRVRRAERGSLKSIGTSGETDGVAAYRATSRYLTNYRGGQYTIATAARTDKQHGLLVYEIFESERRSHREAASSQYDIASRARDEARFERKPIYKFPIASADLSNLHSK